MLVNPPVAPAIPTLTTVHSQTRTDEYAWLRDRSPEVISYLEAENRYTESQMASTASLQTKLYEEMLGRLKQTDLSVPEREGDYYYYSRTEEGKQYAIYCRRQGEAGTEAVLLDQNAMAVGLAYFRVGVVKVSPDGRLLAYTVDTDGSEVYTVRIKDLATGAMLADEVINALGYTLEWGNDNRTIFYVTQDAAKRPYRVWRHALGSEIKDDALVFEESDELFFVGVGKTRSRAYLLIESESKTTSEVLYLKAAEPLGAFQVFAPRIAGVKYSLDHRGDRFYILTDQDAKNSKLLEAPVEDPARHRWQERIPHRPTVKIDNIDLFQDHLVVYERENALKTIRVFDLAAGGEHAIAFPEPVYTYFPARNPEFDTRTLRFNYTSLVTPRSVYDYDLGTRTRVLKKQDEVSHYDSSRYRSERLTATAPDGTRVPISLVYRDDLVKDGSRPCFLYAYGSYGISIDPAFSANRLSLLDRGFSFAIAHVRGGGDLGKAWYEDGKLLKKQNTFTDFVACAEHLVAGGYTAAERLIFGGGSAGGLLIGAVVNLRPELCCAAVAQVPFVDVVNTMLDPTIPLTITEYEEWGNPNEKPYYDYMLSYSPYDNVEAKAYPHLLITAGLNDPRVAYWEPAKWTARLRRLKTDDHLLLLKTNLDSGHGGPSGRYEALKEAAFQYAFMLKVLSMA